MSSLTRQPIIILLLMQIRNLERDWLSGSGSDISHIGRQMELEQLGLQQLGASQESLSSCSFRFFYTVAVIALSGFPYSMAAFWGLKTSREVSTWQVRNFIVFCDLHAVSLPTHSGWLQVSHQAYPDSRRWEVGNPSLSGGNIKVTLQKGVNGGRYCCGHFWNVYTATLDLNS